MWLNLGLETPYLIWHNSLVIEEQCSLCLKLNDIKLERKSTTKKGFSFFKIWGKEWKETIVEGMASILFHILHNPQLWFCCQEIHNGLKSFVIEHSHFFHTYIHEILSKHITYNSIKCISRENAIAWKLVCYFKK